MKTLQRALDQFNVIRITDPRNLPSVTDETRRHILGESQIRVTFDRDVVAVVDPTEVGQLQVTCERRRFAGDAFHQASIATERVDVEVEQVEARAVYVAASHCCAIAIPTLSPMPCPSGPVISLDARGPAVLGMAWTAAIDLAEGLDGIERDRQPILLRVTLVATALTSVRWISE